MSNDLFVLEGKISVDNVSANKAIDETTGKANDLKGALTDTKTSADSVSGGLDNVENSANTAAGKMGKTSKIGAAGVWLGNMFTTLSLKAFNLGKSWVNTGFEFKASMESYEYSFTALLNDADKAKQLVADLHELAKISPLGLEGLANNAVSLLSTGTKLEDILPTLEMIGNLSLGNTDKMNSVLRAYTQVMAKGNLMAQEMYQFSDAGIPIVRLITEYGGERYSDGSWYNQKMNNPDFKIPFEDVHNAFMAATAEGSEWYNYMFTMMDSWKGQVDRMGEQGKETLGAAVEPFFNVAKEDVLPSISESLELLGTFLTENKETLDKWADTLGEVAVSTFDGLLDAMKWIISNKNAVSSALNVIGGALIALFAAAHPYITAITAAITAYIGLNDYLDKKNAADLDAAIAAKNQWYENAESQLSNGADMGDVMATHPDFISHGLVSKAGYDKYEIANLVDKEAAAALGYPVPDYNPNKWTYDSDGNPFTIDDIDAARAEREAEVDAWWASLGASAESAYLWEQRIKILTDNALSTADKIKAIEGMGETEEEERTHLERIRDSKIDDPLGVKYYQDTFSNDWFDKWYKDNINTIDPVDLTWVIDRYDIPTLGKTPTIGDNISSVLSGSSVVIGQLSSKMDAMISILSQISANSRQPIVLETGVMVGALAGGINTTLGNIVTQNERG